MAWVGEVDYLSHQAFYSELAPGGKKIGLGFFHPIMSFDDLFKRTHEKGMVPYRSIGRIESV